MCFLDVVLFIKTYTFLPTITKSKQRIKNDQIEQNIIDKKHRSITNDKNTKYKRN